MEAVDLAVLFLGIAIANFALIVWRTMTYWKVRGVKHIQPLPIIGNMLRALRFDRHFFHIYDKIYHTFPEERMVGMYEFMTPTLVLRDTELVQQVLVRDFSTYPHRGPFGFEPSSILYLSIFNMKGSKWRGLRNKLLTAFTTGKLRSMFETVSSSCLEFINSNPTTLNRGLISKFATRTFMRTMFGIEILDQEEEEVIKNVTKMLEPTRFRIAQQVALIFFPRIANFFRFSFMPKYLDIYFRSLISTILNCRMGCSFEIDNFANILIKLRKAEKLSIFDRVNNGGQLIDITDEIVQAQALFLFFAGLEPTSLMLLHAAYDLSRSKECQMKARQEVKLVLRKYGRYCWEAIKDMNYLHCCIKESLRLHPPLQFINRVCTREAELGGVRLKKGTRIIIPLHTIQMDPKYFPDPQKYDPDRFSEEINDKFSFLPFSEGPRVCMGKRFAIMEVAAFLAHLLENYELSLNQETKLPLKYESKTLFLTPKSKNQIKIDLTRIS